MHFFFSPGAMRGILCVTPRDRPKQGKSREMLDRQVVILCVPKRVHGWNCSLITLFRVWRSSCSSFWRPLWYTSDIIFRVLTWWTSVWYSSVQRKHSYLHVWPRQQSVTPNWVTAQFTINDILSLHFIFLQGLQELLIHHAAPRISFQIFNVIFKLHQLGVSDLSTYTHTAAQTIILWI